MKPGLQGLEIRGELVSKVSLTQCMYFEEQGLIRGREMGGVMAFQEQRGWGRLSLMFHLFKQSHM